VRASFRIADQARITAAHRLKEQSFAPSPLGLLVDRRANDRDYPLGVFGSWKRDVPAVLPDRGSLPLYVGDIARKAFTAAEYEVEDSSLVVF
jgi:hypothetical protein